MPAARQERFRRSLWPIVLGWVAALWVAWWGFSDLTLLLSGGFPARPWGLGWLSPMPRAIQIGVTAGQIALVLPALPSFLEWASRRTLLTVGETGLTIQRWRGWQRIPWNEIAGLSFRFGEAVFEVRREGHLQTIVFRPWTIGLDGDGFRELIERHQPRLTPDEDEGQPWGRSSAFKS